MSDLNTYQHYLIDEFADDYKSRTIDRRELVKRVLLITGSVPLTASMLFALGCGGGSDEKVPSSGASGGGASATVAATPTEVLPTPEAATGPGVTVQPNDPAIRVESVIYKGPASQMKAYMARPRTGGPFPAVLIIHENRGLTEHLRDIARRYAKEGFLGLSVDLISRNGGTTEGQAESAAALSRSKPEELTADLVASVEYLKTLSYVKTGALGVTGFCFGGGYTWEVATTSPDLKAAIPYYGPMNDALMARLPNTKAAVFAMYGGNDTRITSTAPDVEAKLKGAGKIFEYKVYQGANHAFFNDTGGSYNAEAAKDSWTIALAWFRKYLTA